MRFGIFGVGAVGGYFGGRLAQAGEDVTFIARGEHLQALRTKGLRVDSINGDFVLSSVTVTDDPSQVGAVDVVLVGVKTWQVPEAAISIQPLIGENTLVSTSMDFVDTLPPNGTTSLQRDIAANHPSEIDSWSGGAVRQGREAGVSVPTHEFVYNSLLPLELKARGELQFPDSG